MNLGPRSRARGQGPAVKRAFLSRSPLLTEREAMSSTESDTSDDLVWGCVAIAKVIGRSERSTFHMLERRLLPAKRIGRRWCASRRRLLAALTGNDGLYPAPAEQGTAA